MAVGASIANAQIAIRVFVRTRRRPGSPSILPYCRLHRNRLARRAERMETTFCNSVASREDYFPQERYSAGMRHVRGIFIARLLASLLVLAGASTAMQEPGAGDQRTPAAQSTVDSLHALIHAGKFSEMMAKVDMLGSGDPIWK